MAAKAMVQVYESVYNLLLAKFPEDQAQNIARTLTKANGLTIILLPAECCETWDLLSATRCRARYTGLWSSIHNLPSVGLLFNTYLCPSSEDLRRLRPVEKTDVSRLPWQTDTMPGH